MPCARGRCSRLGDLAQVAEPRGLPRRARLPQRARPEDLLLGDDDQVVSREREPTPQRPDQDRQPAAGGREELFCLSVRQNGGRQAERAQQRRQSVGVHATRRDNPDAMPAVDPAAQAVTQRLADVDLIFVVGDLGARLPQLGPERGVRRRFDPHTRRRLRCLVETGDLDGANLQPAARAERLGRLVLAEHELLRRQRQAVLDMAGGGRLAQPARLPARLLDDRFGILHHAERVLRQIVEEGDHPRVERRRQRLDAEEQLALFDLLEKPARLRRRIDRGVGGGQDLGAQGRRPRWGSSRARDAGRRRRAGAASAASPRRKDGSIRSRRRTARSAPGGGRRARRDR